MTTINGLYIEHEKLHKALSGHLVRHIASHGQQGKIAVVCSDPKVLLSATRKQWMVLIRQTQNECSATLNHERIEALTQQLLWMQGLTFTCKPPDDLLEADITFATADDFVHVPPVCRSVYITYDFEREKLYMLTAWMPRNSLVVAYE